MTDTCTCPPGDCHGGHTINISPSTAGSAEAARPTDEQLRTWLDPYGESFPAYWTEEHDDYLDAMFAELLAARARITALEAETREHAQVIEYLHHAHGIEIDREDDDFREWQEQYGA